MPKRKKKEKTKNKPFVYKIEKLIVQHPSLPSLDRSVEVKVEKQQKVIKVLTILIITLIVFIGYQSSLVQMYMENWDIIEPISQLIEWILTLVFCIAYSYIMK